MIARRYVILFSPIPGEAAALIDRVIARCGLSLALQTERLAIFTEDPSACVPLETGEGAFIGTVFAAGYERVATIPRGMSHSIIATSGRAALQGFWGGYVLACEDAYSGNLSISRDPSGAMPCLMVSAGTLTACASDPRSLVAADLLRPVIAYPELLRQIPHPDLCLPETCLAGLRELLPGMRFELTGETQATSVWWSPWDFTQTPSTDNLAEAARQVRETIDGCVGAWVKCCTNVLLNLSGGLDSSVVASALAQATDRVTGLTLYDASADGDERRYARHVCAHLGIPLEEATFEARAVDLRVPSAPNRARPVGAAHMQPLEAALRHHAASVEADAFFNGMAGDSVFCSVRSALPVADSVRRRPRAAAVRRTVRDVGALAGVSGLAVVRQAGRMLLRGRRPLHVAGPAEYLSQTARDSMAELVLPPWLSPPPGTPLGRAYHVEMIARLQNFVDGLDRWSAPPTVAPLLSQPIVERCLRIPSWLWVTGGQDRAVARQAYRDRLPSTIVDRRSKGGPNAMSIAVCLENLPLLRDMLLEGELARRGFLDRQKLERALRAESLIHRGSHLDMLSLAETEAWITQWTSSR